MPRLKMRKWEEKEGGKGPGSQEAWRPGGWEGGKKEGAKLTSSKFFTPLTFHLYPLTFHLYPYTYTLPGPRELCAKSRILDNY